MTAKQSVHFDGNGDDKLIITADDCASQSALSVVCCLCPRLANVIPGTSPLDKPFSIQLVENVEDVGTSLSLKPSADTGAATRYAIPAPARTFAINFLSRKVLSCSLSLDGCTADWLLPDM